MPFWQQYEGSLPLVRPPRSQVTKVMATNQATTHIGSICVSHSIFLPHLIFLADLEMDIFPTPICFLYQLHVVNVRVMPTYASSSQYTVQGITILFHFRNACHYLFDQFTCWSLFHVISIPLCTKTHLGPILLKK